jgi:hypothetical protein
VAPPGMIWILLHPSNLRFTLRQMSLSSWPNETDLNMERVAPLEVVNLPYSYTASIGSYVLQFVLLYKMCLCLIQSKTKVQYAEQHLLYIFTDLLSPDQSIASSCSSLGDEAPTMSEDEEVSDTHTPTQARPNPLNGSRASTAPPGSVVSTADGRRSLHEWPVSPMPWTTLKRKRTESTEGERTE